jgi:hypothetical protein
MAQTFYDMTLALDISVPRSSRLLSWAARVAAKLRARLALARARKVVRALDAAQLSDAGIDVSKILPPRPTITIEAALTTRLMAMR